MPLSRILVVEDDLVIRETLRRALKMDGYEVETAENGLEALQLLESRTSEMPQLILLDLMMPVMSGWEFLEARAGDKNLANIPVVVISAADESHFKTLSAQEFIKKPVDLEHLLSVAARYCLPLSHQPARQNSEL